jgi:hypothetical protein
MTDQIKPEGPDVGESTEAENGGPQFQRTPGKAEGDDPQDPERTSHETPRRDEETTVDAEGQSVAGTADDGGQPNPGR